MTRDDAQKLVGKTATVTWGTQPWKNETATGTVISAGRHTLWLYTDKTPTKPAQDVFIKYEEIK